MTSRDGQQTNPRLGAHLPSRHEEHLRVADAVPSMRGRLDPGRKPPGSVGAPRLACRALRLVCTEVLVHEAYDRGALSYT